MAVRLWILAFGVEPEVLGQYMQELSLTRLHGLESHIALVGLGKDAELAFLVFGPFDAIPEELQREILVGDMIVCVISIHIQSLGELAIALLAKTLVVALDRFALWPFRVDTRSKTFDLLLAPLAVAGKEGF